MLRKPNSIRRWLGLVAFLCCPGLPLASRAGDTDCNGNGIPDEQDLRTEVAFGQPYSVPTREVRASVLADVDADGDLDVLLQLFFQFDAVPQRWVLLRNDGTGHFAADENPPPLVGGEIVAADFNADGQMDLLLVGRLATDPEGPLHLRLYSTPVDWNSPQSDQVLSNPIGGVRAVDIDSDGDLDLVACQIPDTRQINVLENVDGIFEERDSIEFAGEQVYVYSLSVGDLNRDGRADLAVVWEEYNPRSIAQHVELLLNTGSNSFELGPEVALSENLRPAAVRILDTNRDGNGDLLLKVIDLSKRQWYDSPGNYSYLFHFPGLGDGTFLPPHTVLLNTNDPMFADHLLLADVNNDGHPDVVSRAAWNFNSECHSGWQFDVLYSNTAGEYADIVHSYHFPSLFFDIGASMGDPQPVDLNGDGWLDLVVAAQSGDNHGSFIWYWLNRRDGTFEVDPALGCSGVVTFPAETYFSVGTLQIADLTGDGIPDLSVGSSVYHPAYDYTYSWDVIPNATTPPVSLDRDGNGVPDECDPDCNHNGAPDGLDLRTGRSQDCNANAVPDECDIAAGDSPDCNGNGVPDECELAGGCSEDCNENGVPDECDIADGNSADCDGNGIPDECELAGGCSEDCNENSVPDECDIAGGDSADCDGNGIPDECQLAAGSSEDCNANGVPDACDIASGDSPDCDGNGIPDECQLAAGSSEDCNANGVPDACDIAAGDSLDRDGNGIPDECENAGGVGPDAEPKEPANQTGSWACPLAGAAVLVTGVFGCWATRRRRGS